MYYHCSENKEADQLRGYREAVLRLWFRICKKPVFSRRGSNKTAILGDHLCEECAEMYGSGPAPGGTELPCHRYTQGYDTGGKVIQVYLESVI